MALEEVEDLLGRAGAGCCDRISCPTGLAAPSGRDLLVSELDNLFKRGLHQPGCRCTTRRDDLGLDLIHSTATDADVANVLATCPREMDVIATTMASVAVVANPAEGADRVALRRLGPACQLVNQIPGATRTGTSIDRAAPEMVGVGGVRRRSTEAVVDLQLVALDELQNVAQDRGVDLLAGLAGNRNDAARGEPTLAMTTSMMGTGLAEHLAQPEAVHRVHGRLNDTLVCPVQDRLASAKSISSLVTTAHALLADEAATGKHDLTRCVGGLLVSPAVRLLRSGQAEVDVLLAHRRECLVGLVADVGQTLVGDLHQAEPHGSPGRSDVASQAPERLGGVDPHVAD